MKKTLPSTDIANELSGSSVFFTAKERREATKPPAVPTKTRAATAQKVNLTTAAEKPHSDDTKPSSKHDTVIPRHRDTKTPGNQPLVKSPTRPSTTPAVVSTEMSPDMLEEVRKVVKQLGKEAATHRFSMEEKRALADLVYTYHRQGYRTSENEITRIAVNWLLIDFKERGEQSVLARMLERLHG